METHLCLTALALALLAAAPQVAAARQVQGPLPSAQALDASATPTGRDWIVKAADNICGLRDANQLTHPAQVDFDACLTATPEFKRIKDQGIDPKSAEGIQLRNAAVTRVTNACESVQDGAGHCSVWKQIQHKDGRSIPDITDQVKAKL